MSTMEEMEAVDANFTWYRLNSNFQDPTYQYLVNVFNEFRLRNPVPKTNFTIIDGNFIIDSSPVLYYGNLPCHNREKEAYMNSTLTCALFQLPFILENFQFGYICFAAVFPIMLISVFGGIKESYRWYFLNQAIWDLLGCYDFICESPTLIGWFGNSWEKKSTCFYVSNDPKINLILRCFLDAIRDSIRYAPFIPIFLIAFSRFISIYFPIFYQKTFSKPAKSCIFIVFFNLLFLFLVCFRRLMITYILHPMMVEQEKYCVATFCSNNQTARACFEKSEGYFQCSNCATITYIKGVQTLKDIPNFILPTMFLLSNLFVGLLLLKIAFQLKYQLKTNRYTFIKTLKIVAVVSFQCFTMSFIVVITAIQMYLQSKALGNVRSDLSIYNSLPQWLFFLQYYTTSASFNIIRVFLDSFIVLVVLNGYSSCIVKSFKFVFSRFKNPISTMQKMKAKWNGQKSKIIILSSNKNS